jgi:hypothetical protein
MPSATGRRQTYTVRNVGTGKTLQSLLSAGEARGFARGYNHFSDGPSDRAILIPEAVTIRYADDAEPIEVDAD